MLVRGSSLIAFATRASLVGALGFVVLGGCAEGQLAARGSGALTDDDAGDEDAATDASEDGAETPREDSGGSEPAEAGGDEPDAGDVVDAGPSPDAAGDAGGGNAKCQQTTCKQDLDCLLALCITSKCVNGYCS